MPEISVIMSIKNDDSNYLKKSIESILNQSFKNFEFIIILDGSDESTIQKITRMLQDGELLYQSAISEGSESGWENAQ